MYDSSFNTYISYGEASLKCHNFLVAMIEALFFEQCVAFNGLYDGLNFFY